MIKRTDFGGYGDIARAFNQKGDRYHSPWVFEWLKARLRCRIESAKILDLGCGTGNITRYLAGCNFAEVIGVDPDSRMIGVARMTSDIRYEVAFPSRLPFEDEHFDAIVIHGAFEHFCNKPTALRELERVAKEGTGLLLTVTWPLGELGRKRSEVIRRFLRHAPHKRTPRYVDSGFASLLNRYRFVDVETKRKCATVAYTLAEARLYMRRSGRLSEVPRRTLPTVYEELDQLCEREQDEFGRLFQTLEVIADSGYFGEHGYI